MQPQLGLSIVICTRSRPNDLIRCVSSIAKQSLPMLSMEIVLMDDGELTISQFLEISQLIELTSIDLRYHKKLQPGLLISRMESLAVTSYELLLFLDDDVELDANYLLHLVQTYQDHEDVSGIGGRDRLIQRASLVWRLYGRLFLYSSGVSGKLSASGYGGSMSDWSGMKYNFCTDFLLGCNMSFRKSALNGLEAVDWLQSYSLGEDLYLSYIAKQTGKLLVCPQLTVKHHQSVASRDKDEQVAYMEIVNHYYLLQLKNATSRQYMYQLWTALGLMVRAVLKKNLHNRIKGYWRAIGFISYRLISITRSEGR
jgi:GT2 family glycosyltransferase